MSIEIEFVPDRRRCTVDLKLKKTIPGPNGDREVFLIVRQEEIHQLQRDLDQRLAHEFESLKRDMIAERDAERFAADKRRDNGQRAQVEKRRKELMIERLQKR